MSESSSLRGSVTSEKHPNTHLPHLKAKATVSNLQATGRATPVQTPTSAWLYCKDNSAQLQFNTKLPMDVVDT